MPGLEMDLAAHRVRRDGKAIQLGPTEYRLLRHFLENPGRVFSRQQLLETVWPHSEDIELRTVDVHIRRLRKAISAAASPTSIRTVRSAGYALDAEGACLSRSSPPHWAAHGTQEQGTRPAATPIARASGASMRSPRRSTIPTARC